MYDRDADHVSESLSSKLLSIYNLRSSSRVNFEDDFLYAELLNDLGNPHLSLPPVVHIAGTNGKGSTLAYLRALLEGQKKSVHVYTSPHLLKFNERIVLAGTDISDDVLEAALDHVLAVNDGRACSFFEIATALAFYLFSRVDADYVLLETGLGGRLDCTNVVPDPVLSILSAMGLDHQEFLGHTIEEIAAEKAGILKRGVPCVLGFQDGDFDVSVRRTVLSASGCLGVDVIVPKVLWDKDLPVLMGAHQQQNFNTALCAFEQLGFEINQAVMERGAHDVRWPGRFEWIDGAGVWFDGGHNAQAGRALAHNLRDKKDLCLIVGMSAGRDAGAYLRAFADRENFSVWAVDVDVPAETVAAAARELKFGDVRVFKDIGLAIAEAKKAGKLTVVCGSLYLYGRVVSL